MDSTSDLVGNSEEANHPHSGDDTSECIDHHLMRHCKAHCVVESASVSDEVKTRLKQQYANVRSGRPQTGAGQVDGGSAPPERKQNTARRWWEARIVRQNEIDTSIAAKADFEYLYDKPYEDRGIVRVAGPFTVESLAPHRTLGVDENDNVIDHLAETKTDPALDSLLANINVLHRRPSITPRLLLQTGQNSGKKSGQNLRDSQPETVQLRLPRMSGSHLPATDTGQ